MKKIIKLLHIELFKCNNKTAYILIGLFAYFSIGTFSITSGFDLPTAENVFDAIKRIHFSGYSIAFGSFMFSIFIIQNVAIDFKHGMLSRHLTEGYSKRDYFAGKILLILFLGLLFSAIYLFLHAVMFLMFHSLGEEIFWLHIDLMLYFKIYLVFVFYALAGLLSVMLFKKSLVSALLFAAFLVMEFLARIVTRVSNLNLEVERYLPFQAFRQLLMLDQTPDPAKIMVSLVAVLIFIVVSFSMLKKMEL